MGAIVDEPAGESAAYDRAEQGEGSALELAEGAVCGQTCLQVQQGVELLQVAGDEQLSYLFSLRLGVANFHWISLGLQTLRVLPTPCTTVRGASQKPLGSEGEYSTDVLGRQIGEGGEALNH